MPFCPWAFTKPTVNCDRSVAHAKSSRSGKRWPWLHATLLFPVLLHFRSSRILKGMEVHFSPDVETRLQQLAFANGKDAEQLVKDTVARMLENQARFIAGVQKGIEQADRGEFVEHKDVLNRIDRLFHS